MNRKQLIEYIAEQTDIPENMAEVTLKAVFDGITQAMVAGDSIQIPGFGGFSTKVRAAREGRKPSYWSDPSYCKIHNPRL